MVIKYFFTSTCDLCKVFEPIVREVAAELGISVEYIDVLIDKDSTQRYYIAGVPAIVMVDNNISIRRHIGDMNKQQLKEYLIY